MNKDVILAELATAGLHGRLLAWTSDFITDRRAKVRFQNCTSNAQSFENGTYFEPIQSFFFQLCHEHFSTVRTPRGGSSSSRSLDYTDKPAC